MKDFQGIIFTYNATPELRELVAHRTAASLPFCGRYRLIDFSLSSLRNAGILDVGVIMQRDYQSLLDHLGGGKEWDMSRSVGGLRLLPPFGLPEYHRGSYTGTMEALNGVYTFITLNSKKYFVLMIGHLCANIDIAAACRQHLQSSAEITAVCAHKAPDKLQHRFVPDKDGFSRRIRYDCADEGEGLPSLETYIINKETLVALMDYCRAGGLCSFHRDAIANYLREGGKIGIYTHSGYAKTIRSIPVYLEASMDMLESENRASLFPASRPVLTKKREGVSTYYGEKASSRNSLIGDDCIIEGCVENSIIFSGSRVAEGAVIKNCIIMSGGDVGPSAQLNYVIADKNVSFSGGARITGCASLPVVAPKFTKV